MNRSVRSEDADALDCVAAGKRAGIEAELPVVAGRKPEAILVRAGRGLEPGVARRDFPESKTGVEEQLHMSQAMLDSIVTADSVSARIAHCVREKPDD